MRKWLNGKSFICGVFRFCYGAGGVWVKCFFLLLLLLLLLFSFLIFKIDFEFDLHQTNCHSPRIFLNKRFINSKKSIFNILSIIRTLANTISIQSLKTPKIYAHMLIQFQDHVKKYSQIDEPPNTSQYTRPQITKQRWTNRTDNEYRYYSRNHQFQIFKCFMLFTSDSKNGPTWTNALILVLGRQLTTSVKSKQISAKPVISQNQGNIELTNSKRKHLRSSEWTALAVVQYFKSLFTNRNGSKSANKKKVKLKND